MFKVSGKKAKKTFAHESGGHRWQRVPPTEKKGRRQTSTITVAVLQIPTTTEIKIDPDDLDWKTCRGSGAGGQARNKLETAVQLTHIPTNTSVRCENEKSQHRNRETALELLGARLLADKTKTVNSQRAKDRQAQVGSGMRADKRRTIRTQDNLVTDHILNKTWSLKDYLKGNW